jgi:hypothetical protein
MSDQSGETNMIEIDLTGMHPTYARQVRLMLKQIESWFGWKHIAFVLELVESGPRLDERGEHEWNPAKAKKFATKAEAIEWCGDRHVSRGGMVTVVSLVEKAGELHTLGLFDGDHSLLETRTPSDWLRLINEHAARFGAVDGCGDIGAMAVSIRRVERLPAPSDDAD